MLHTTTISAPEFIQVQDHQSGKKRMEGMATIAGRDKPVKNSRVRETASVLWVKCIVTAKWNMTLTNDPSRVPNATPMAPNRLAR